MRCEGVSKRYAGRGWLLRDVALDVQPGTVTELRGGNGSGKTTLLRILGGMTRPTRGSVDGRPSTVGYVPDRLTVHPRVSATTYLDHLGRLHGLSTAEARYRGRVLLDRLGFEGRPSAPLSTLSKGNLQKVAVAQAALARPQLLLMDEPCSGLDTASHGRLSEVVADLATAGTAVLYSSHHPDGIAGPDRVLVLADGTLGEGER